jgi:preprotein translocase subunit SecF
MRFFQNADYKFIEGAGRPTWSARRDQAPGSWPCWLRLTGKGWVNYGVDFTGGTIVQVEFDEPTTWASPRCAWAPCRGGGHPVRRENEFLIRVPEFAEEGTNTSEIITATLTASTARVVPVVRTEAVGPKIGAELQQKALLAILMSFGLTLIYLAFRFEWRFGVAAVIATVHDILITLGFIAALRIEVSLPTVAAVLTIIGYSLNDTIVVFDRIRENLKGPRRRTRTSTSSTGPSTRCCPGRS